MGTSRHAFSADQQCGRQRGRRRHDQRNAPVDATEGIEQVRRCGAECKRPDQDADHQSHVALGPRRRQLHAHRIDTGHADAGHDAQRRGRHRRRIDDEQQHIGRGGDGRSGSEEPARVEAVSQPQHCAGEAADDESGLHSAGQRGLRKVRQMEFCGERLNYRGRGKPQRHRHHLAYGNDRHRSDFGIRQRHSPSSCLHANATTRSLAG